MFLLSCIEFSQEIGGLKITTPVFYDDVIIPAGGAILSVQLIKKIKGIFERIKTLDNTQFSIERKT